MNAQELFNKIKANNKFTIDSTTWTLSSLTYTFDGTYLSFKKSGAEYLYNLEAIPLVILP